VPPVWKYVGIALAAVALCAAAWFELVSDWQTPRSDFVAGHALGTNVSMSLVSFGDFAKEMRTKHGMYTKVALDPKSGRAWAELDGKVLHEESMTQTITSVIGLFVVGRRGHAADMAFPFRLAPDQKLTDIDRVSASAIRTRFEKSGLPQRWQTLSDRDWSVDRCTSLPSGLGLGGPGLLIGLRKGTACVVTWRRAQTPVSMLVSVSIAEGDPWLRPFSRRLCREITETALALVERGEAERPAFAGCILIDRPGRKGAKEVLIQHSYSIGPGHQLALMK
jgi:hypothetical protein